MKIQNAKLPQASMVAGRLQTRNGAICINGNYSLFYDGMLVLFLHYLKSEHFQFECIPLF